MYEVIPIPAFKDNYMWLIINKQLGEVIVVDPGEASPVLNYIKKQNLTLIAILVTHKHADHTGGINELLTAYPDIAIYAHPDEKISLVTHLVQDNTVFSIKNWPVSFSVIHIPGHTLGHVAFYMQSILFSGDTLFSAGCGRVFEGTAAQMHSSLNKLASLADDTLIYCGHEYTLANLKFALHVEPNNPEILQRIRVIEKLRLDQQPSLPSTMLIERKTNPFLRCAEKSIIESVEHHAQRKLASQVEVFHELREWKNSF